MAICRYCGQEIKDTQAYCDNCGAEQIRKPEPQPEPVFQQEAPQYDYQPAQPEQKNGKSTAALVLGIISLVGNTVCNCLCGCIGGLPTLITSIVGLILASNAINEAMQQGREDQTAKTGRTLCIIALVVFFVVLVINMILGVAVEIY